MWRCPQALSNQMGNSARWYIINDEPKVPSNEQLLEYLVSFNNWHPSSSSLLAPSSSTTCHQQILFGLPTALLTLIMEYTARCPTHVVAVYHISPYDTHDRFRVHVWNPLISNMATPSDDDSSNSVERPNDEVNNSNYRMLPSSSIKFATPNLHFGSCYSYSINDDIIIMIDQSPDRYATVDIVIYWYIISKNEWRSYIISCPNAPRRERTYTFRVVSQRIVATVMSDARNDEYYASRLNLDEMFTRSIPLPSSSLISTSSGLREFKKRFELLPAPVNDIPPRSGDDDEDDGVYRLPVAVKNDTDWWPLVSPSTSIHIPATPPPLSIGINGVYHSWPYVSTNGGGYRYCSVKARWRQIHASLPGSPGYYEKAVLCRVPYGGNGTLMIVDAYATPKGDERPAYYSPITNKWSQLNWTLGNDMSCTWAGIINHNSIHVIGRIRPITDPMQKYPPPPFAHWSLTLKSFDHLIAPRQRQEPTVAPGDDHEKPPSWILHRVFPQDVMLTSVTFT
jgi:hypothetical protein